MKKQLLEQLKPLYAQFHEIIPENYRLFCMQWGESFPQAPKDGILFVGRATNGWVVDSHDVDVLFGESSDRIFARDDQMVWVHNAEGDPKYNTNLSAFWRVIKGVSQYYHPKEWYNNVAWSNLCKAAPPESGNPSDPVFFDTLELNRQILKVEIDTLSPKFVVMLTKNNGWAAFYLNWLNGDQEPECIASADWSKYTVKLYLIHGVYYIVSEHPMKKEEQSHIEAIISLMGKANDVSTK